MQIKKFKIGFLAILLGGIIAVTQSAFKPAHVRKYDAAQWIFNGTTIAQDKSASNYTMVDGSHPVPDNCSGTSLPCYITVDGDLQTYLDANTAADIRSNADEKRN
jgi:hypothetical protein